MRHFGNFLLKINNLVTWLVFNVIQRKKYSLVGKTNSGMLKPRNLNIFQIKYKFLMNTTYTHSTKSNLVFFKLNLKISYKLNISKLIKKVFFKDVESVLPSDLKK